MKTKAKTIKSALILSTAGIFLLAGCSSANVIDDTTPTDNGNNTDSSNVSNVEETWVQVPLDESQEGKDFKGEFVITGETNKTGTITITGSDGCNNLVESEHELIVNGDEAVIAFGMIPTTRMACMSENLEVIPVLDIKTGIIKDGVMTLEDGNGQDVAKLELS